MPNEITTYEEAWKAEPDGRTSDEMYDSIVQQMKDDYQLSDADAHDAARSLINYCKEIMSICSVKVE